MREATVQISDQQAMKKKNNGVLSKTDYDLRVTEFVQPMVVPKTADITILKINETKMPLNLHESLDLRSVANKKIPSLTSDLFKEQQLQEEERHLLAMIRQMSGETSPASGPRVMKRLIPTPGDIDSDLTEKGKPSNTPTDITALSQLSVITCSNDLQKIRLSDTEEPLVEDEV